MYHTAFDNAPTKEKTEALFMTLIFEQQENNRMALISNSKYRRPANALAFVTCGKMAKPFTVVSCEARR